MLDLFFTKINFSNELIVHAIHSILLASNFGIVVAMVNGSLMMDCANQTVFDISVTLCFGFRVYYFQPQIYVIFVQHILAYFYNRSVYLLFESEKLNY